MSVLCLVLKHRKITVCIMQQFFTSSDGSIWLFRDTMDNDMNDTKQNIVL